jgi:hypothetical protein
MYAAGYAEEYRRRRQDEPGGRSGRHQQAGRDRRRRGRINQGGI